MESNSMKLTHKKQGSKENRRKKSVKLKETYDSYINLYLNGCLKTKTKNRNKIEERSR